MAGVDLGDSILEIGPGFGPATEALSTLGVSVTALELDDALAAKLRNRFGDSVDVVSGDATDMPFEDGSFTAVVCFTMLHHVPSRDAQDQLFEEVRRVLAPGGRFTGTDSVGKGLGFALLHVGDDKVLLDLEELPSRFARAGLRDVDVHADGETIWFRAAAPT